MLTRLVGQAGNYVRRLGKLNYILRHSHRMK